MDACTVIVAGKDATVDGSVILATNDDWPGYPAHLVHVKRKRHKPGDKFTLVRGKKIPQVAE
ncbi:MAG: C69 family dipeptidase, partial [Candidatus Omnitrophica bacterium]|nr:C69 family dipeptidase [Candidatus Omnitrophota bacterium]